MKINKIEIVCLLLYLIVMFSSHFFFSVREDLFYVVDVIFWNGGVLYLKVYLIIPAIYFVSCLINERYSFRIYTQFSLMCYVFFQNIISMIIWVFYVSHDITHILFFFVNVLLFFVLGYYFFNVVKVIPSRISAVIVAVSSFLVFVPHIFFLVYSLKP